MRHLKKKTKFNQKKALFKSLLSNIILKEKIKITQANAKELQKLTEKFITKAKKGDLSSRRYLLRYLKPNLVKKLITEIVPRYKERNGGYTRIIKLGPRKSNGARMAIIELV